jgi:outer membrane autotransporter protein
MKIDIFGLRRNPKLKNHAGPLAAIALVAIMASAAPAYAVCTPAAGNDVTATCTGTTTNQDNPIGYGTGAETNLNTSVASGATVTGTTAGIAFTTGSVTNSGAITGGTYGVFGQTVTVTDSGSITGVAAYGIHATDSATVTNSGSITGGLAGVIVQNGPAMVTNSGTITAASLYGVAAQLDVTVINSGTIAVTNGYGIYSNSGAVTVTNTGSITSANGNGIFARTTATVTNSGTIVGTGATRVGIQVGTTGDITNSGTIIGGSGTAIRFNANGVAASDTLTVLPGAQFGGLVDFGGADKVNFGAGSWFLNTANFNGSLSSVTTPGNPYFVMPNQIVVADVSGFGAQNRAIMDITGWISSVLPDTPVFAPGAGGGANSFAAVDSAASPFEAFASFPPDALGYAATKAPVLKAASVTYADGNAVWAKGFGGQRQQDTNGAFIGGTTTGYGGAVGYERLLDPDLKIGALVGGSTNKTNLYLSAGSSNTDTVFGGAYGRKMWGATFLDLAVIGGNLDNTSARNIGDGLALQTATASYGGWFVDPSLTVGHRIDIDGRGFAITPAMKLRYVAAHFDGYTETGSAANLTVAGRDFQAFEERAEITFANTLTMANGSHLTGRVTGGILGQQRSTGGEVNIALLGQSFLAATRDRGSIAGGYGSAGLDWQMGKLTLFAAG